MANEGIEVEVYRHTDPLTMVATLQGRKDPKFLREIAGNGGGQIDINVHDGKIEADPTLLDYRNLLKFKVDGLYIGAMLITSKTSTTVSEGEASEQVYSVAGESLKSWFDDAIILPYGGLKATSPDTRAFNFATERGPWYDDTKWRTPYVIAAVGGGQWQNRPDKWPVNSGAMWLWGAPFVPPASAVSESITLFRYEFTTAVTGTYELYFALDDYLDAWLDGQQIITTDHKADAFKTAVKVEVYLEAGPHIIGIKGQNITQGGATGDPGGTTGNPAGLLFSLYYLDSGVEKLIASSGGSGWQSYYQPDPFPGWSSGEVLQMLMDEAESRGVKFPTWVNPTFTLTEDSDGVPWTNQLDWQFNIGDSMSSVVSKLEELGCYIWIDADTLNLNMTMSRGVDRSAYQYQSGGPTYHNYMNSPLPVPGAPNWASGSTGSLSAPVFMTDPDGTPFARFTLTAAVASAIRLGYNSTVLPDGMVYGSVQVRTSGDTSVEFNIRKGAGTASVATTSANVIAGQWKTLSKSYLSVAGTDYSLAPVINRNAPGLPIGGYIDVRMPQISDADRPWFMGGSTPSAQTIYGWLGATNNSTSVEMWQRVIPGSEPVTFAIGKNLTKATSQGTGKIKNSLAVKTAVGWMMDGTSWDPSVAIYGTLESSLDTGASEDVSHQLAQVVFLQRATAEEGATYEFIVTDGLVPFKDFNEGDWVLAPNDRGLSVKRRIMSISLTENDNGKPAYAIEFDTIFQDNDARVNNILNKTGGSGVGGGFSNSSGGTTSVNPPILVGGNNGPPILIPKQPQNLAATSEGKWSADGVTPYSEITLTWDPVTENLNGSETIPQFYAVWGHLTSSPDSAYIQLALVTDNEAVMRPFDPGADWTFKVSAQNSAEEISIFSTEFVFAGVGPTAPMPAPDTPTLSSNKGVLIVNWDGLLANEVPPPQFRYVYASVATTAVGAGSRMGPVLNRDARNISIPGLTVGQQYWVELIAVDGVGIPSATSVRSSIVLTGIDLGDLDEEVGEAIEAAHEAALQAQSSINLLTDNSFELNTEEFWDLAATHVTNVTTHPRSGLRHLRVEAIGSDYEAFRYQRVLPCDEGESYYVRIYAFPEISVGDDSQEGGLELHILHGPSETSTPDVTIIGSSQILPGSDYSALIGNWTVPAGAFFFKPRLMVKDTTTDNVYYLDDIRIYKMTDEPTLVNGSITTDKLSADSVTANKIAADAIAADNIQAGAIIAGKIAVGAVTAETVAAGSIGTNALQAGSVTTQILDAGVGGELDISANSTVTIIAGNIDNVQNDVNATTSNLEEMQTYYTFGVDGAVVSTPSSPFSLALRNDRIEMLENGNVVSYWNSGQMYVSQFVGEKVILGNHQLEKYETGTVVRAI